MIDKLTYDQILEISKQLNEQANIIQKLLETRNIQQLKDFAATVEGYSKFLETTVEINKDADEALADLRNMQK